MPIAKSWDGLRRALLRITRKHRLTQADAEDVVQGVLEQLIRHGAGLAVPEMLPCERYLRKMCLNVVRSAHRSRIRRQRRESEWEETREPEHSPEDAAILRVSEARLVATLSTVAASMPSHVAAAFLLCDIEGLSAPKAALALDVPEGTVRTRLRRFRTALDAALRAEQLERMVSGSDFSTIAEIDRSGRGVYPKE